MLEVMDTPPPEDVELPVDPTLVQGLHFTGPDAITLDDIPPGELPVDEVGEIPDGDWFGAAYNPAKVRFRGGYTCECVASSLPLVEKDMIRRGIIKRNIDLFQLGWNPGRVAASAGTHDKGGPIDVGQFSDAALAVWWDWGWWMQRRTRAQGFSGDHGHGGPMGCSHGAQLATWQMNAYKRGLNGLRSNGPAQGPWRTMPTWREAIRQNEAEEAAAKAAKAIAAAPPISFNRTMHGITGPGKGKPSGNVRLVQQMLNRSSNSKVAIGRALVEDGIWGPETQRVYANFQRLIGYRGAAADGIPGRASFKRLVEWRQTWRAVA